MKPIIGYVCWNRMGFTVQNLNLLLDVDEDFDLYIVDNGSQDNTWKYLQTLKDSRIKHIIQFKSNYGLVYALNYVISKRKANQPFINIDADASILTKNFIKNCEDVIDKFPEVGLLGNVRPTFYKERSVSYEEIVRDNVTFWKTKGILGCLLYFPSSTLDALGYFSEELHMCDLELNFRLNKMNKWVGFCPKNHVEYKMPSCKNCLNKGTCSPKQEKECFTRYNKNYGHHEFYKQNAKKFLEYKKNCTDIYCASIHDKKSQEKTSYDLNKAQFNFNFYKKRT